MAKRVLNCYVMSVQNSLPYRKTISSKMKKTWNNRSVVLQKDTMDRVGEQWSVSENGNKKETYTYQEETVQVSRTQWWKRYWKIWYSHDRLRERGKTMHDIVILSKWSGKQDSGEIKKQNLLIVESHDCLYPDESWHIKKIIFYKAYLTTFSLRIKTF